MVQGGDDGRDHHPNCFTMWLAGGGVKAGTTVGESDQFGFNATPTKFMSTICTRPCCTCSV